MGAGIDMKSFRSLLLAFLWTQCRASRPEPDEVHIATNGHFVRAGLAVDREDARDHRRVQHRGAENSSKKEVPHSEVVEPHHLQDVVAHENFRDENNDAGQSIGDQSRSQRMIHMSTTMHKESKRYEKALMHAIAQSEGNHNSSAWSMDHHNAFESAGRNWNDCLPYLVTRVFIIALIIYTFMRNHLSQPLQEINDLVVKPRLQEVRTHAAETRRGDPRHEKAESAQVVSSQKSSEAGDIEEEDEDQNQESRAQPVEERLGKAIEDSLSEVEDWLRSEAEASNGPITHYDISTPRGLPEPAPTEEPPLQHYQRRKLPESGKSISSSPSTTSSDVLVRLPLKEQTMEVPVNEQN